MRYCRSKGLIEHTDLVEHLVALVEDELADVAKLEMLVANKRIETTWRGDDDVWMCLLIPQNFDVLVDLSASIEDTSLHVWQVLAETLVLGADLVGQFTSVAHDKHGGLALDWLDLLERSKHEDGGLTET